MWRTLTEFDPHFNPFFHGQFSDSWQDDHIKKHKGQRELYSSADLDINFRTWQMSTEEIILKTTQMFEILLHKDLVQYQALDSLFGTGANNLSLTHILFMIVHDLD